MRRAPWEVKLPIILPRTNRMDASLDGTIIELLEPAGLEALEDGTEVISIFGERMVKGVDNLDNDTRFGFLPYGLIREDQTNRNLGVFEVKNA